MDDQEARDLLIRIDAQQVEIFRRLVRMEERMGNQRCDANVARIKALEDGHKTMSQRAWMVILAVVGVAIKVFWPGA